MAVTLTHISRSSDVSVTLADRNGQSASIGIGSPMGLLLALTYASTISIDGLTVTLIDKN